MRSSIAYSLIPSVGLMAVLLLMPGGVPPSWMPASSSSVAAVGFAEAKQPEEWQDELVAWLRAKPNGYFSDKIQWQRIDPTDPTSSYAMHAIDDIDQNERIMVIPQSAMIIPTKAGDECETVQLMLDEYDRGSESAFYPYLKYLFDGQDGGTKPGLLPSTWSTEAQELLKTVVGPDLLPDDFYHYTAVERCGGRRRPGNNNADIIANDDPVKAQRREDAYLYLISRSWSDKMVPILDMINHRNGRWFNVESTSAHVGEDIVVYAFRPIQKGEQLYNSYNECLDRDCDDIKYTYVTPHIVVDYGFVELYPRRWMVEIPRDGIVDADEDLEDIEYDIFVAEVDEDDERSGKVTLAWHLRKPNDRQVAWIEMQLDRLKGLEKHVTESAESLSSMHEKGTILDLFYGYKELFELALVHIHDDVVAEPEYEEEDEL